MKKYLIIISSFFFLSFISTEVNFTVPKNWPSPFYNFAKNPLSANKIELGRALFYETGLSQDGTVSCASCHSPYSSFTHIDHAVSHGINNAIGTRNSPALVNLAWQKSFMWDGAIKNLDVQALAPISHPSEMGSSIQEVVSKLNQNSLYKILFFKAYGDSSITDERTLKAISQFLLTLVSSNSKYDQVKAKKAEFTLQEENGYKLFQTNCNSCHKEPLFTTGDFANNGLRLDSILKDVGKMKITSNTNDSLRFKIPTLRNIEYSYPYMHDGRFKKLSEVINHYTSGIQQSSTLAKELKRKIDLTSNEKVDLISFLLTLSDKEFVFNSKFQYPTDVYSLEQKITK